MKHIGSVKILFIAGFGPIVREVTASRKLYGHTLGINSQKRRAVTFIQRL